MTTPCHLDQRCARAIGLRPAASVRGFSLIELVIVVVILGIIGAIAIPRMGQQVARSKVAALVATTRHLQDAVDRYTAEHEGRDPARDKNGALDTVGANFVLRIKGHTQLDGNPDTRGIYGPYLLKWPTNPNNGLESVRIDGVPAGADRDGWHYDSRTGVILPDDADGAADVGSNAAPPAV